MKRIALSLFLIITTASLAQTNTFQGKIKYDIIYEGVNASEMSAFGFNGMTFHYLDQKVRVHFDSQFLASLISDFIVDETNDTTYMIDDVEKVAYFITPEPEDTVSAENNASAISTTIVETNETEKILGHKCIKYLVTEKTDSTENVVEYWISHKLKTTHEESFGFARNLRIDGIEGFALRMVAQVEGITITYEVVELDKKLPDPSLFKIPSSYQIKDYSESPLMQLSDGN